MSNRVIIDQTINTVTTDQCPDIHNSVVVNNDTPSTIGVTENVTNIVTVAVPGPQGPAGPQGPIGLGGDITGSQYYAAIYKSATALFTGSIYDSGSFTGVGAIASIHAGAPERFFVDASDTDSYNLISGHGTINNYLQLNIKNFSSGNTGSSDVVATADNGDEFSQFIDMGINSSGYNVQGGIGGSNDAYLYSTGQDLLIGNASSGKRVIIFNGSGPALDNARVYITGQGTVGINSSDASLSNPEALLVEQLVSGAYSPTDFNNLIIGRGTVNENYMQLNMINKGSGSAASTDIVATNDIGNESSYYIDMGINSSGFNIPNAIGIANDAYLYSTGRHLHIGNASNYPIQFFVGGLDTDVNRKMQLNVNGKHEMTGSLTATQGFTGSLFGTSSWAENAITASHALTASYAQTIYNSDGLISSNRIVDVNNKTLTFSNTNNVYYSSSAGTFINLQASSNTAFISMNYYDTGSNLIGGWGYGNSNVISPVYRSKIYFAGVNVPYSIIMNSVETSRNFVNGNVRIQTGGTYTDNGYKLQVAFQNTSSGSLWVSGSSVITGSLSVTEGITGSLFGTASWALNAITASYVDAAAVVGLNLSRIATGSITASVSNTDISASFRLTSGSNTLLNVTRDGFVWIGNGSFINQGYQLDVNGTSYFNNDVTIATSRSIISQANSIYFGSSGIFNNRWSFVTNNITHGIHIGTIYALNNATAILELTSTNQGFLPPRTNLTSNISNPAQGLITYLTGSTNEGLWYYDSGSIKNWTKVLNNTGSQSISGSLNVTQAVTASNLLVTNTITAQTLIVQTVTSSIVYSSGSNIFGNQLTNTQQFTGSVTVTGSLAVNGSPVILTNQTSSMTVASASLATTASYVFNTVSASYSATASIAVSSSYALTASYVSGSSSTSVSASYAATSSYSTAFYVSGTLNVGKTNIEFQENTNITSGSWRVVSSEPTASYKAAFFDYVMFSGSIARAGTVYSVWSASYAEYYENYTGDVGGSTSGVTLQAAISGSNIQLQATASNSTWTIRSLVRML